MYHVPLADRTEAWKPSGRQIGVDRRRPVGEPEAAVGLDSGMPCREAGRHHRRLVKGEQLERAVRGRERDDERTRLGAQGVLVRRERERRAHRCRVQAERSEPRRVDGDGPSRRCDGFRRARPEGLRVVGVDGQHRLPRHRACPDHRGRDCDRQNQPDQGGEARTLLAPRTAAFVARAGHVPLPSSLSRSGESIPGSRA